MHILFTNYDMQNLGGSTLYVCDMALEMKRRGHKVSCFSLLLGRAAEKLMAEGIQVTSDLRSLEQPDVIHAHHPLETRLAAASFPFTPLVYASLGPLHPLERPTQAYNCITRYIAISEEVRQMLIREEGIAVNEVSVVPNFVDLNRFTPQKSISNRPRNVLLLTTYFSSEGLIQGACEIAGNLELKQIGQGELVWNVEDYIEWADVVITSARGALEAMAMGRATIVYRPTGSDGLITSGNFEASFASNFNGQAFKRNLTVEDLASQMLDYKLADVEEVKETVRTRLSSVKVADDLLLIYKTTIQEFKVKWTPDKIELRLQGIMDDLACTLIRYKELEAVKGHTELLLQYLISERENLRVREQNYLDQIRALKGRENNFVLEVSSLKEELEKINEQLEEINYQNMTLNSELDVKSHNLAGLSVEFSEGLIYIKSLEETLAQKNVDQEKQARLSYVLWEQKNEAVKMADEAHLLLEQVTNGKVLRFLNSVRRLFYRLSQLSIRGKS